MRRLLVIGLDLGTTACKAVVLDAAGRVQATATAPSSLRSTAPGQAEQDAADLWAAAAAALRDLVRQAPGQALAGLSLSGAMHSLLPLGQNLQPLAPAVTWADRRGAEAAAGLRRRQDAADLYHRTGCPLQPTYHLAKLRWWRGAEPRLLTRAQRVAGLKDYVVFRLTGRLATDWSIASATGLLDIRRRVWDPAALRLAGITAAQLPELVSPTAVVGGLTAAAAREAGLPAGLPVVAGASDGALANVGAGAAGGQTVASVGTSGAIRVIARRPKLDSRSDPGTGQRTWCYALWPGRYLAGGAINNGGLTLQWVRERFYGDVRDDGEAYAAIEAEAAAAMPGASGVVMLPYLAGERSPHWDADARAAVTGLALHHSRGDVARAALEGVAFCLADVWQVVRTPEAAGAGIRLTGGITRSHLWCQIVADVLGMAVYPIEAADASACGAALLGHAALGHLPSLEATALPGGTGAAVAPDPLRHRAYRGLHRQFQELSQRLVFRRGDFV